MMHKLFYIPILNHVFEKYEIINKMIYNLRKRNPETVSAFGKWTSALSQHSIFCR